MEESEGFNLIDVSSENDSLIDALSSTLTHLSQSSGDIGGDGVDGTDLSNGFGEQLFEASEPESLRKPGKFNLRKSLAWDSAFLESPGFLDAEDISIMIDGAERSKQHLLPGIDEDIISRSTESISTLVCENLTLECLEADLFEDIRASIQKSSKASGNLKALPKETDKVAKCSVKKVDVTSRNRIATNATSTMQTGGMQGSRRILKKDSSFPLVTQPDSRHFNSTSSLPQSPRVISKPETMSTFTNKRVSLGVNRTRIETNNSKAGVKGIQVPKAAGVAGPRRSVPKPASSLVTSSAAIKEVGRYSSSSNNSSNSNFTKKVHKSPSTSARTKTESEPVIKASSCSIPKASSKVPLRKMPSGKSGPLSSLMSSKTSSNVLPSSSITKRSSASSTSTVNQRLMSRTSIDTNTLCSTVNQRLSASMCIDTNSSCRSMDSDTPSILSSDVQSNDDISDGYTNRFKEFPSQDTKKASAQSSVLPRSALIKPSGLRLPSPKIGFFDGAKSVVRTPNGCRQSQSRLPTGLPKIGAAICSPVGSLKKAEEKIPLVKKATAGANAVLDTSKYASPKLSQEPSRASMKDHDAHRGVLSPNISSEVRSSNKGTGKRRPGMTLTSTNLELEGQNSASPIPFQENAPGVSPEVHNEMDGSNCFKAEDMKIGKPDSAKDATATAPEAENDENLLLDI